MSVILGNTVCTPLSPKKMAEEVEKVLQPVKTVNGKAPDENGNVEVEVNGNANITESDPTVPSWAKQSTKPSYSKSEVGLGNVDNVRQYSANNPPPYPVVSVNGKTNVVTLGASDVGARPSTWTPTYSDVGADKSGTASSAISSHNTNTSAHNDLRLLIEGLTTRLNALANSDDTTLDQMKEIVDYIKSNRDLIQGITTTKINYTDIINDLATNVADKPLSAAQGVVLKALIDKINDAGYLTSFTETDPNVPSWAKQPNKPSYSAEEVGAVSLDGIADAINMALAIAKESGEFDGNDGADGYTPIKGVDYYTEADKSEFSKYIASELAKRGQLYPEFANSVEECTDTTKLYVLPDGFIWAYIRKTVEGGTVPNFENALEKAEAIDSTDKFEGKGYITGNYLTSSTPFYKAGSANEWATGYIPYTVGKPVYIKGTSFTTASHDRMFFFSSKDTRVVPAINNGSDITTYFTVEQVDDYYKLTPLDSADWNDSTQYMRMGFTTGTPSDVIITVDEPITYSTVEGGVVYELANTGHAFVPADYEDRIISLETDLATAKEDIKELQNSTTTTPSGEIIPQAVVTGASDLVDKALSRADGNVLRFVIYSDAHQYNENAEITKGNIELGKAIGEVVNQIGVDFVSGIGDSAWASYKNTAEEVKAQIKQFNRYVYPYIKGEQILNCEGNHDDAVYSTIDNDGDGIPSSTEKLSLAETFSLIYARNKNVVFDAEHYLDGYCYKDFEHLKVRVICLNTEQGTGDGGVVESYQIEWLEDVALNMTDKTDWQVVTLAHHPFSYGTTSLNAVVDIIDAFIKNGGKYIGHFHGHAHAFSVVKMQKNVNGTFTDINAWEICIPNACYTRNNQYLGNTNARLARYSTPTTYNKTDEDGKRTSFNLVTVCLDIKKIYADNYGAGIDREISY